MTSVGGTPVVDPDPEPEVEKIIAYTGGSAVRGLNVDQGELAIGHQFTVDEEGILLVDVGVWDEGANGLSAAHTITLFSLSALGKDAAATQVPGASLTIPAGQTAQLIDGFRFMPLDEPLELAPGPYALIVYGLDEMDPYGDGGHVPVPRSGVEHGSFVPYQFADLASPTYPAGGGINETLSVSFRFETGKAAPLRILPLGDSITWGVGGTDAGYRAPLAELLNGSDIAFQFVGNDTANAGSLSLIQKHHEGHPGWVISSGTSGRDGLAEHLDTWLGPTGVHPSAVLLMIGSNDVDLNYQMDHAEERLDALVSNIFTLLPDVHLVLAQVTGLTDSTKDARAVAFNEQVAHVAEKHQLAGEHVTLVSMYDAVPLTDMADWIHPNDAGYDKMAVTWMDALIP